MFVAGGSCCHICRATDFAMFQPVGGFELHISQQNVRTRGQQNVGRRESVGAMLDSSLVGGLVSWSPRLPG